jgi:hypothetical protein
MFVSSIQKNIQGPCGNNAYECLDSMNEFEPMDIPRWNDEQLIIGQAYSTISGSYGRVTMIIFCFTRN